jgi:hypothetical protein
MLSGECIKACDYGVNPRFLLAMARVAMLKDRAGLSERRRNGVTRYRDTARDVTVLWRLQLDAAVLERLGQGAASASKPSEPPGFVFYTGCNVLKTPHIALLALDVMDALGIKYQVMGGPSHCCGILQTPAGDVKMSGRMGSSSIEKMSHGKSGQVLAWCPSCYVQFTETTLPSLERQNGSRPFEMTPFIRFLRARIDDLRPHLRDRVELRIALHQHPGVAGVVQDAVEILQAVPSITLIYLEQPCRRPPECEYGSACCVPARAGAEGARGGAHRRRRRAGGCLSLRLSGAMCPERDWPFRIRNLLEIVGQSMGLKRHDRFKQLKIMQDADLIVAECRDLIAGHGLDPNLARDVVANAMLGEQPLPLSRGQPRLEPGRENLEVAPGAAVPRASVGS